MRITVRLILLILLVTFSFLTGFTYRDLGAGYDMRSVVGSLSTVPNKIGAALTGALPGSQAELSPVDTYSSVYAYLDSKYYGSKKPESTELTYAAIRGMLAELGDRYTRFLDPKEYRQMQQENRGDFEGIGARLEQQHGQVVIVEPIPDSPAKKAGLKPNDVILKVDGKSVHGIDLTDVVQLIRGQRGTKVVLSIQRENVPEPFDVEIVRAVIVSPIVESRMEDPERKIGYISLAQFNEKSDRLFDEHLTKLESDGLRALILDLRNNPGGLLDVARDIGSRFIEKGNIVLVQEEGRLSALPVDSSKHNHQRYPLVVLINGGSASASEIVAGAIQDHQAGVLVGTTTFGKGLIQRIITLDGGSAIAVTTAKYLTPNKRDVSKDKIKPDYVVEPTSTDIDSETDVQLKKAVEILAAKLNSGDKTTATTNRRKI